MKRFIWLLSFTLCFRVPAVYAADQILTFTGLGPVRLGMTPRQAATALGVDLKPAYPDQTKECWFANRGDGIDSQIHYMVEKGKIVRIDIDRYGFGGTEDVPTVATERGIHMGSLTAEVKNAYGSDATIRFHPQGNYGDESTLFITVMNRNKRSGILFEIWEGRVQNFWAGFREQVAQDEPCIQYLR